jgi:hypothetical protein
MRISHLMDKAAKFDFQPKGICNSSTDELGGGGAEASGSDSLSTIEQGVNSALGIAGVVNNSLNANQPIAQPTVLVSPTSGSSSFIWIGVLLVVGFIVFREIE